MSPATRCTMAPFLRIAFNSYDLGALSAGADSPFCAIKMKEALTTGELLISPGGQCVVRG